jgi:hypothetical protein
MAAIAEENAFGRITVNGHAEINNMNMFCKKMIHS